MVWLLWVRVGAVQPLVNLLSSWFVWVGDLDSLGLLVCCV